MAGLTTVNTASDEDLNILEIQLEKQAWKKKMAYVGGKREKFEIFSLAEISAMDHQNCQIPLYKLS